MPSPSPNRLLALDWLRGLVMVLMTVDHASHVFNGRGIAPDSYLFGAVGADLAPDGSPWPFLTRWVTHLCAPVFLFLAGASVALSTAARERRGDSAWSIDRHFLLRGLLLILLEAWMFLAWPGQVVQVLYAIGVGLVAIALVRHLPTWVPVVLGATYLILGEYVIVRAGLQPDPLGFQDQPGPWTAAFLLPWFELQSEPQVWLGMQLHPIRVLNYPAAGWVAMLFLGYGFGRWLLGLRGAPDMAQRAARFCAIGGALMLVGFLALRGLTNYGNFWLERTDGTWLRWLQVSKYPPSLAFALLELGLGGLLLSAFFRIQARGWGTGGWGPLTVLGQTALFYYLIHAHLLRWVGAAFFEIDPLAVGTYGPLSAWIGAGACVLALWPLCLGYRLWKLGLG